MNVAISFFLSIAKRYWKHLLLAAGVIFAVMFIHNKWVDYKKDLIAQGYVSGYKSAAEKFKKRVEISQKENTNIEENLNKATDEHSNKKAKSNKARRAKEDKLALEISESMSDTPDDLNEKCSIPKNVLEARNAIRAWPN